MVVQLLQRSEIDCAVWDTLNRNSADFRLCMDSGYLDAICHQWSALAVMQGETIVCALPLNEHVKLGMHFVLQPSFAQYFRVLVNRPAFNSNQIDLALQLLEKSLRRQADLLIYKMDHGIASHKTLRSSGLRTKPLYSFELDLGCSWEKIYHGFSTSITNHKTKAEKHGILIEESQDVDAFLNQCKAQTYFTKKEFAVLQKLWLYLKDNNQVLLLSALDADGNLHATGMFSIGANRMTFLVSVVQRQYRHWGANSLLICKAMQIAMEKGLAVFDFEGSMLRGPEKFYLGFRPKKVEYVQISSGNAFLFSLRRSLKWLLRANNAPARSVQI